MIEADGYRDLQPIGHGGLGDVYRAVRISTGGTVAIKVLRDVSDSSVAWHRTRRELTALVSLTGHAHVVQLIELLDLPDGPALVMEHAPGGSIGDLVETADAPLGVAEIVMIGRHAAAALVAAHALDIVHRDVKPQNLLIDAYGQVKLCDFGIASLARSTEFRTRTSALSMRYASPEDLEEDGQVGPASDVYSLGATLLHLAHGAPPSLKERLAGWEPPPTDDADVRRLDEVISACLQPTPSARPTAADVLDRLESLDWTPAARCRALRVDAPPVAAPGPWPRPPAPASAAVGPIMSFDDDRPGAARSPLLDGHDTSARTVLRPGRMAPPAPPSAPAVHRRRWPWIAATVSAAATIGVVAAVLVPDPPTAPTTSDAADPGRAPLNSPSVDPSPSVDAPTATGTLHSAPSPARSAPVDTTLGDAAAGRSTADEPAADNSGTGRQRRSSPSSAGSSSGDSPSAAIQTVERPDHLASIDGDDIVWPFGGVGGCLVLPEDGTELQPVSCERPHDLQRISVAELGAEQFPVDVTFDQDAVDRATEEACRRAFDRFVGVPPTASRLDIAVTRPSAATWLGGDRRFQCLLGVPGRQLVGDAETSGA